jgi:hypothetical protein
MLNRFGKSTSPRKGAGRALRGFCRASKAHEDETDQGSFTFDSVVHVLGAPALALVLLISAPALGAQLARRGGEFLINSYTEGNQRDARVVGLPNGGFAVAWENEGQIVLRRFDSSTTPIAPEIQVNSPGACYPPQPRLASTSDGSVLVAWCVTDSEGNRSVDGRRYLSQGQPQGEQFRIAGDLYQGLNVAALEPNRFVVTWTGYYSGYATFVRDDLEEGQPFKILTSGSQYNVAVAGRQDSFQVVWFDGYGLMLGRPFNGNSPNGEPFEIGRVSGSIHEGPVICSDSGTNFVVAWATYAPNDDIPVSYRLFGASGKAQTAPLRVTPSETLPFQAGPSLACGSADDFAIMWREISTDPRLTKFRGRSFTREGPIPNSDFRIGQRQSGEGSGNGSLARLTDGDLLVVWHDCGAPGGCDIFGQRLTFAATADCPGDCNHDNRVTIDELIEAVAIAVNSSPSALMKLCLPADVDLDYEISLQELVQASGQALRGCP